MHHRDPNLQELRRLAENRSSQLFGPEDLPGSRLFEEFCGDTIKRWQLGDRVITAKVTRIQPKSGRFRLWFEDGKSTRVRSYPEGNRPPSNCRRLQCKTAFTSVGKSNSNPASRRKNAPLASSRFAKFAIARKTNINCRRRTNQRTFSSRINCQRSPSLLMTRRYFPGKLFDTEPGWLGPKYLKEFAAEPDWHSRWETIQQARNGGSMTPEIRMRIIFDRWFSRPASGVSRKKPFWGKNGVRSHCIGDRQIQHCTLALASNN